jgi:hypothetical protein
LGCFLKGPPQERAAKKDPPQERAAKKGPAQERAAKFAEKNVVIRTMESGDADVVPFGAKQSPKKRTRSEER